MKISTNDLRKMIIEQIEEDEPVTMDRATSKFRASKDSVDDQIDSWLIKFEEDSMASTAESIMESLRGFNLEALLFEQEEGEGDAAPEENLGVEEPAGSEDITVDEPMEVTKKPPMNIDAFSKRVARLAIGYQTKLDVPTVIINRAINYLRDNYDQSYIEKMKEILDTQFDFNLESEREPVTPMAGGRSPALGAFGEPEGLPATGGGGVEG